jgi:hypothetical protein
MTYKEFRANGKVFDITKTHILLEDMHGEVHHIALRNVTAWERGEFTSDDDFLSAVWQDVITSSDCAAYFPELGNS